MNVIHLVTNRAWGGGERYVLDLCRTLRADGHRVDVLTRRKSAPREIFEAEGLRKGTIGPGGPLDILSPVRLARHLRGIEGEAIVHVHNFKDAATAEAARKLLPDPGRIRIVCTRHLVKPAPTEQSRVGVLAALDAIIFVSDKARQVFLSTNPAIDNARLHTVHNSIPDPGRAESSRPADALGPVKILYVGRISPEKGVDTLIRSLGKISTLPWTAEICGTGQARHVMPLMRMARELGIADRIDWPGHVSEPLRRMASADIIVLPTRAPEAFGLTLLEAMSQGVPVVTTDNGAQPEIITDSIEGLLVAPDDPQAMADALRRLAESPTLRRDIGERGRETFAGRFGYDRFYNDIIDIYHGH
ncbi:MAG: glycosyltransferase family 4 protein [Bacteroidales bacterium]|nr:glycosyltransferase family 4 protein [Bacteroidales bacterium]